jgi:TetR/AcrR family transcriptional repressor of nem operon
MKKSETTRLTILQKSFELIYIQGYQTTSIDDIIATTKVTKGAFYYHFKSKDEMGLAIIEEILKPSLLTGFILPFEKEEDPLKTIYDVMKNLLLENDFVKIEYGCPASNITQEMSPWNKDFTKALNELTEIWRQTMVESIEKGKKKNLVRKDVNAMQVALFVLSGYWGVRNFGKLYNDKKVFESYLEELRVYLDSLK